MRNLAFLALALGCAACAPVAAPIGAAAAAPPACETSTVPVEVGGRPEEATVTACPQPDGSWRITQETPGLPPQVYLAPAPPPEEYPSSYSPAPPPEEYPSSYSDYFDYWPLWGGPWFWGIGPSVVVVQQVQHFHHFHHFRGIHPGGPGHPGMPHAIPHGFAHTAGAPIGGAGRR